MTIKIINGDALTVLRTMKSDRVQTCVTSPPYFGLRDYGIAGQLGLEQTPTEYVNKLVEIFREVRRVLRPDGTLWLNLGDSYAGSWGNQGRKETRGAQRPINGEMLQQVNDGRYPNKQTKTGSLENTPGLKPKDLIGIPWRVAQALQAPYYSGQIKNEIDRTWLAALVDGEGSICGTQYTFGNAIKTNLYITVTNSNEALLARCEELFPQEVKHLYKKDGEVNKTVWRWDVEQMQVKQKFVTELYPYLIAKKKQAIIAWNFLEMQKGLPSKKKGYLSEQQEQRNWMMRALSVLNKGGNVDLPAWMIEPPSLYEDGYYLRQDIIWSKPNPMPESVRDRCTKSHEYLFMFSKQPKYYFDAGAIAEPVAASTIERVSQANLANQQGSSRVPGKTNGNMKAVIRKQDGHGRRHAGFNGRYFDGAEKSPVRNRRSVWTISTKPFKEAHFATFPPDLVEPCILAGAPQYAAVLDPFAGSGTVGMVANKLQRHAILIELNPAYCEMAARRCNLEQTPAPAHSSQTQEHPQNVPPPSP